MKILLLSEMFPKRLAPLHGTFVLEMAKSFRRTDEVRAISPRFIFPLRFKRDWLNIYRAQPIQDTVEGIRAEYPTVPGIPYYFPIRWQYRALKWSLVPFLRKIRSRFPFDIIHNVGILPTGWAAIHAGETLGIPVINTAVGTDLNVYPNLPHILPAVRKVLQKSYAVTTLGEGLRENALRAGGSPDRVFNMPFGFDPKLFSHTETNRDPIILFLGQLIKRKGIQRLIEAFPYVQQKHPKARIEVIGNGHLMVPMKEECKRLNISNAVTFHGNKPHHTMNTYYDRAWLYCLPSDAEGWPIASMDALASGVPVVGTQLPGLKQQVEEGKTGTLVPVEDRDALSNALIQALSKDWDRKAIEQSMSEYTLEAVGKRYCELFQRAIEDYKR